MHTNALVAFRRSWEHDCSIQYPSHGSLICSGCKLRKVSSHCGLRSYQSRRCNCFVCASPVNPSRVARGLHGRDRLHRGLKELVTLSYDTYLLRIPVSLAGYRNQYADGPVVPPLWKELSCILPSARSLALGLVRARFLLIGNVRGR